MTVRTTVRFRSDGEASRMYWGDTHDVYRQHYATGGPDRAPVGPADLGSEGHPEPRDHGAPGGRRLSCAGCSARRKCVLGWTFWLTGGRLKPFIWICSWGGVGRVPEKIDSGAIWCVLQGVCMTGTASLIQSDPAVLMGKLVVAGSRIAVELILEKLSAGETIDQLLEARPQRSQRTHPMAALCCCLLCGPTPVLAGVAGV